MQSALKRWAIVPVALGVLLSSTVAWAQDIDPDAPADEDESEEEQEAAPVEVQVIGVKADAMQKVPGSGTVIRPEEIERAEASEAAELLRRVPGVHTRQDSGGGGRLDISLRGLDPGRSRRVLLLEDGIPIQNNPYAEPDLYWSPPPQRWQAIEVVKGSGSILYGPQTISGVINFITPYAPWKREVTLEAKAGQRNTFGAFGRYGDRHGDVGYLAQVYFMRGDGFRAQSFRTVDALGKVDFATSDKGHATIKIGVHDVLADSDDVGLTVPMFEADPARSTLSPNSQSKLSRYSISLTHDHAFNDIVSLRTLSYAYTLEREWRRQDYVRFADPSVPYDRIIGDPTVPEGALFFEEQNRVLDRNYWVAGVEPRLQLRFGSAAMSHTVDTGVRVLVEGAHYEQRNGDTPTTYAGASVLDETRTSVAFAGYVQDRMAVLDELILITPGVRFEYVRYDRQIDRQPTAAGAEDVDISGDNETATVIPGVGMTAGTPDMHGFAGVHVGFAPPRVASAVAASGESIQLDEERSLTYEIGARLQQRKLWRLEVGGFLNNFFNQVVPSSAGAITLLVNGGTTRHFGAESAAGVSFGELIGHGILLDVLGRYTLVRAEFVGGPNDGNDLPYAPSHLASGVLDVGHDIGIAAQLAYSFVGPQFTDQANTIDADITGRAGEIDAYHRIDANVRYHEKHSGLTASVSVKDLLDQPFIISRRPEGIFAAGFRQVMFGLRWDYEQDTLSE